jgi:hypothetical protein
VLCATWNCSLGTWPALFDHLVGAGEHGRWHGESQFLCGLEIDHQFVLGRRLYRKISRLLAIEDAIDISGRAPILVDKIGSIGDQAASDGERALEVDRAACAGQQV